jgi:hypothetical protein
MPPDDDGLTIEICRVYVDINTFPILEIVRICWFGFKNIVSVSVADFTQHAQDYTVLYFQQ